MRQVRHRLTTVAFAGVLLVAPPLTSSPAYAAQTIAVPQEVIFNGAPLGLGCQATPTVQVLSVPAGSTIQVVNRTSYDAFLRLGTEIKGALYPGGSMGVMFQLGTTAVTLEPTCLPAPKPTPVLVTAVPTPAAVPAAVPTAVQLPDPALPDPALPDPALPDPALPDPALPDPAVPDPALPDPAVPDPALPDPAVPDPALPDPALPDPALPDPALPGPALPGPALPDSVLNNPITVPDPSSKEPIQTPPGQGDTPAAVVNQPAAAPDGPSGGSAIGRQIQTLVGTPGASFKSASGLPAAAGETVESGVLGDRLSLRANVAPAGVRVSGADPAAAERADAAKPLPEPPQLGLLAAIAGVFAVGVGVAAIRAFTAERAYQAMFR